jgi:hypothetical protein
MNVMIHARSAAHVVSSQRFLAAFQLGIGLAVIMYPELAHAYMGQQFLQAITSTYLAPIAFFVIIGSVASYMFAPQHGGTILKVLIGIIVLFAVIKGGNSIVGNLGNISENN